MTASGVGLDSSRGQESYRCGFQDNLGNSTLFSVTDTNTPLSRQTLVCDLPDWSLGAGVATIGVVDTIDNIWIPTYSVDMSFNLLEVIHSVTPLTGPASGNTHITVIGRGFVNDTYTAVFRWADVNLPRQALYINESSLVIKSPRWPRSAGGVLVTIYKSSGETVNGSNPLIYTYFEVIERSTPDRGRVFGAYMTVEGVGFQSGEISYECVLSVLCDVSCSDDCVHSCLATSGSSLNVSRCLEGCSENEKNLVLRSERTGPRSHSSTVIDCILPTWNHEAQAMQVNLLHRGFAVAIAGTLSSFELTAAWTVASLGETVNFQGGLPITIHGKGFGTSLKSGYHCQLLDASDTRCARHPTPSGCRFVDSADYSLPMQFRGPFNASSTTEIVCWIPTWRFMHPVAYLRLVAGDSLVEKVYSTSQMITFVGLPEVQTSVGQSGLDAVSVTVLGKDFGLVDLSPQVRIGASACEHTRWVSSTSLHCAVPKAFFGVSGNRIAVTVAPWRVGTSSQALELSVLTYTVEINLSLPMTVAEFDNSTQRRLRLALAKAANSTLTGVSIDNIDGMDSSRRRLLDESVRVRCTVRVSDKSSADVFSARLTANNSNSQIMLAGLPQPRILQPATVSVSRRVLSEIGGFTFVCPAGSFASPSSGDICVDCPAGTFQPSDGALAPDDCFHCGAGKFSAKRAATQCTDCAQSKYSISSSGNNHEDSCLSCGTHADSPAGSSTKESCACNAGSWGPAMGATSLMLNCTLCNAGKILAVSGEINDTCSDCLPGKFSAIPGKSLCLDCAVGEFSNASASTCSQCEPGKFNSNNASASCASCGANANSPAGSTTIQSCACNSGSFGPAPGAGSQMLNCTLCVAGKFLNGTTSTDTCALCATGTISSAGATACAGCGAGSYLKQPGGCKSCDPGKFSADNAAVTCTECEAGKFRAETGATMACLDCGAGKYSDTAAAAVCTECAVGKYNTLTTGNDDAIYCLECDTVNADFAVSAKGSSVLSNCSCKAGYYGPLPTATATAIHCTQCGAGKFRAEAGATVEGDCKDCGAGKFADTAATTECTQCEAGKYNAQTSGNDQTDSCLSCSTASPTFAISVTGAIAVSECFCKPGYYHSSNETAGGVNVGIQCTACDSGKISASAASTCTACGPGTYANANSDACTICEAGKISKQNRSMSCVACRAGSYADANATACVDCPAGTYSDNNITGVTACTLCDAHGRATSPADGTAVNVSACQCAAGYFGLAASNQESSINCTACSAGKFLGTAGGKTVGDCIKCAGGTFQKSIAASECTECEAGKFKPPPSSNSLNDDDCFQCSSDLAHTATSPAGSDSVTKCVCSVGYWGSIQTPAANSISCIACAAGKIQPTTGAVWISSCIACKAGKFANASEGASACTNCPSGKYSLISATVCTNCDSMTQATSPADGSADSLSKCKCIAGFWGSPVEGDLSMTCTACNAGKFRATVGATVPADCEDCPVGTYSATIGSQSIGMCLPCAPGNPSAGHTAKSGAITVNECECAAGHFGAAPASHQANISCTACPRGKFRATPGAVVEADCDPCAQGSYSQSNGTTRCTECAAGKHHSVFGSKNASDCVDCDAGKFASATRASCINCPRGKYNEFKGRDSMHDCLPCGSSGAGNVGATTSSSGSQARTLCYCDKGYWGNISGADAACTACVAGKFLNTTDATSETSCRDCGAGTYSGTAASTTCSLCAAGKYNQRPTGNDAESKCFGCGTNVAGNAAPQTVTDGAGTRNKTLCKCEKGYYGDVANWAFVGATFSFPCTACPEGKTTSTNGATLLEDCVA